jgi:hypothetical protein
MRNAIDLFSALANVNTLTLTNRVYISQVDDKFLFVDYAYAMRQAQERSLSVSDDGEYQANRQLVRRATSAPF